MQNTVEPKQNFLTRPLKFVAHWRSLPPYELIGYVMMFAAPTMFAYGIHSYTLQVVILVLLTIGTLYVAYFAALIWNDITDEDIDIVVHPKRPIPQGQISPRRFFAVALVFSALTFLFSVLMSLWCFILVGVTAAFVAVHDKYLKRIVKLPAYSEIFTPVQWLTMPLLGFFAVWTALPPVGDFTANVPILGYLSVQRSQLIPMILLVLFTYFVDDAHDVAEGIHDVEGDRRLGVKTYATSFGEQTAAKMSFAMYLFSGVLGFLLFYYTLLSWIFFIPFLGFWLYTIQYSYRLIKTTDELQRRPLGRLVGRKGFDFLIASYVLIFFDVLLQVLNVTYLHWF
ncbi:MAG TPA: UbiA prenyltransferase family protein [Candidatus Thermoplasmatota archaeon]|nr:UbiA prenyltransferase family protein [Candidatus Thermoplasmatota archaeon]